MPKRGKNAKEEAPPPASFDLSQLTSQLQGSANELYSKLPSGNELVNDPMAHPEALSGIGAVLVVFACFFLLRRRPRKSMWNGIYVAMKTHVPVAGLKPHPFEHPEAMALKDTLRDPLLKEAFQATDVDSSGSISQEELTSFGYFISGNSWSLEEAKKVFAKTDKDHDGKISLEEFKEFCFERTKHLSSAIFQAIIHSYVEVCALNEVRKKLIKDVYDKIDVKGVGHLTYGELEPFGRFLNPKFGKADLDKMVAQMDMDKSGQVSYHEFLGYFAKLSKVYPDDAKFKNVFEKYLEYHLKKA